MVRHLSRDTLEATLSAHFSQYGELEKCRLVRDIVTGISRGYAFVEFKEDNGLKKAMHKKDNIVIDGAGIVIDYEIERTLSGWVPRRFGGGFGGKKESGQLRFGGCERPFRRPIPLDSMPLGKKGKEQFADSHNKRDRSVSSSSRGSSYSGERSKRQCR